MMGVHVSYRMRHSWIQPRPPARCPAKASSCEHWCSTRSELPYLLSKALPPTLRGVRGVRSSQHPLVRLQRRPGQRSPRCRGLFGVHRSCDDVEELIVTVLAQLPEHHTAEVMRLDVLRLDRDRLRIIVGDEGSRGTVPQIGS